MTGLRQFLTLCLVAVLLAGAALAASPAAALATPPAVPAPQGDTSGDDLVGTYVSDVFPAASAPGLVQLLSLYPNQNAELVSYYFSNPPVIEQGTWESTDAGVVVSLTGSTDRTYDQPNQETFTVQGDTLVSRGFVLHKLDTITPEQMDAADQAVAASADAASEVTAAEEMTATTEVTATEATTATEESTGGEEATGDQPESSAEYQVFVSDVYPAADASGMVMLMALFPNNNMEQLTVYLGKDAILEVGTWAEGTDGSIETTLTGQLDTDYETPVRTTYIRDGDMLSDGVFTFHPLRILTPADMEASVNPMSTAGTYVSKLYPAADAPGLVIVLSLYPNNNVDQATIYLGKGTHQEQGTWAAEDDGSITVTLTGSLNGPYNTPSTTTYTRSGDQLSDGIFEFARLPTVTPAEMDAATEADSSTDGDEESSQSPTEESADGSTSTDAAGSDTTGSETTDESTAPAAAEPVAVYRSDTLPAADSPGRMITLSLYKGGEAEMSTDFLNDNPPIVETGTWERGDDGRLTLTLTHGANGSEYATPTVIGFDEADGTLTAVDFDESLWGSEGLTLHAEQ